MNNILFSALEPNARSAIENLNQIIPRPAGGLTEVIWMFWKTDKSGPLAVDPVMMRKRYPADRYTLTVLTQSRELLPWPCEDIRPLLNGFRIFEINDPNFAPSCRAIFPNNIEVEIDGRLFVSFENKHFVSDKMLAAFAEDTTIEYRRKDELAVVEVNHGIVHPLQISATGQTENCQYGGVTDANLNFVELSATARVAGRDFSSVIPMWYVGASPDTNVADIELIDEEVVFLGPFSKHYGHFILEGLARLWFFLDSNHLKYKAVYLSEPGPDRFNDLFAFFGLPPENLIRISKPTAFRKVIVPEQSMRIQDSYHQNYKETIDRIKSRVPPEKYKKVYFSKEMRFNNRGIGEKPIEQVFVQNGYQIFYPERLSMLETLSILKGCESFAASSGTNAHNAIFLNDNANSICLNRSPHVHYIQTMIDRMKTLDSYYVEANVSLLPADWSVGPFLFGPTRHLLAFFDYVGFKYNAQALYDSFPKYMVEFLRAWGRYYNDDERKTYIDPAESNVTLDDLIVNVVDTFSHMQPDMSEHIDGAA